MVDLADEARRAPGGDKLAARVEDVRGMVARLLAVTHSARFHAHIGWYDGYTSGVARCRTCRRCYHFELLCIAKKAPYGRVYGFAELPTTAYELAARETAATPASWKSGLTESMVTDGTERNLIVVSEDLSKTVTGARLVPFDDWLALVLRT